ncbi:MAG: hypothetical protein V7K49_26730 [Nostoc sp.]
MIREIPRLGEVEPTITNAQTRVQSPTAETLPTPEVVQVMGVKTNSTPKGVEIILQTSMNTKILRNLAFQRHRYLSLVVGLVVMLNFNFE